VTPAATARAIRASMSEPKRMSSRCACASITRARLGGDALETREQSGARLHRITRLQHTPLRDILPSRLLRMHDAEELADLRADVRRVGIEQVRGEAYGLDAGVERALELAALALVLHQLPGLRALEVLIPFAHQGEDRSECVGEVKARRRRVVLLERLLGTRSQ